jgi:hypothetical protein
MVDKDLSSEEFAWLYTIVVSNNLSKKRLKNELACYSSDDYSREIPEHEMEKILNLE